MPAKGPTKLELETCNPRQESALVYLPIPSHELGFVNFVCLFLEHNCTPSGKKAVTGVQVITASQAQSIGCRWQALFVLPITEAHTSRW